MATISILVDGRSGTNLCRVKEFFGKSIKAHRQQQDVVCHSFHLFLSLLLSGKWAAVRLLLLLRRLYSWSKHYSLPPTTKSPLLQFIHSRTTHRVNDLNSTLIGVSDAIRIIFFLSWVRHWSKRRSSSSSTRTPLFHLFNSCTIHQVYWLQCALLFFWGWTPHWWKRWSSQPHQAFHSEMSSNNVIRVRLIFSGELAKHAVSEGTKAGSNQPFRPFILFGILHCTYRQTPFTSSQPLRSHLVVLRIPSSGICKASVEKAFKCWGRAWSSVRPI